MVGELGAAFGEDACFLRDTRALRVGFVEGQAALLDARFLSWFFEQGLTRAIMREQLQHSTEAGPDAVWCGAAAEWAASGREQRVHTAAHLRVARPGFLHFSDLSELGRERHRQQLADEDTDTFRPACAVVPVPIPHDDERSLAANNVRHFHNSFKALRDAGIRDTLMKCQARGRHGRECMRHNWTRYLPVPEWPLPTDVEGMKLVRACATTRMSRAKCSSLPRDQKGGGVRFSANSEERDGSHHSAHRSGNVECDELTSLYWRDNSF